MSGPPKYRRCAECDQVITRRPIFILKDWFCRHCGKAREHLLTIDQYREVNRE